MPAINPDHPEKSEPRLLARVHEKIRLKHLSPRTEKSYSRWIVGFIKHHKLCQPAVMGRDEVTEYLSYLATGRKVAASTQNQALAALLFLYREVLGLDLLWLDELVRAKPTKRLPAVLSQSEVRLLLNNLNGLHHTMSLLLYGARFRLFEIIT